MKNILVFVMFLVLFLTFSEVVVASGGGGGRGGGGRRGAVPSGITINSEEARTKNIDVINLYLVSRSSNGYYSLDDKKTGEARKLKLIKVHNDAHDLTKTLSYSCVEFKDAKTGETVDVDFDVRSKNGRQYVERTNIHKVDGQKRYKYVNRRRIAVKTKSGKKKNLKTDSGSSK